MPPRIMMLGLTLALSGIAVAAQQSSARSAIAADPIPTAETIMANVAANQDREDAERNHYIYVQHAHVASRKGKTVMCEETTDFRIVPSAKGERAELLKLDGRMLVKHGYISYNKVAAYRDETGDEDKTKIAADHNSLSIEIAGENTDRDLVEHLRSNLTRDDAAEESKDGIRAALFPLTSKLQAEYAFHLVGRERMNGRDVYHLSFHPRDKSDFGWKGDAYVDTTAYQPVVVTTDMARKVPLPVRTLLGTNVPGLGFTVVYAPQTDRIWFPVNFSTEFKLRVLFFFSREILIDARNRDFEQTHVTSKIVSANDQDVSTPRP